jgi:iron complex outermembrane receptor protein
MTAPGGRSPFSSRDTILKSFATFSVSLIALAWSVGLQAQDAAPATAQATPAPKPDTEEPVPDSRTIIVTGERIRGQLIVDQPPIAEYDAADIKSFGGSSIADIIDALGPATSSGRGSRGGRPVILVNGIRVSSFREISSYPPEAIAKVEVLSEDVAQRFGFDPDQRVVNIVLKNDYASLTGEFELEAPDSGGYSRNQEEATYLKIANGGRLNFNLDVQDASPLTEAERGFFVASSIPGVTDEAPYRTLLSDTYSVEGTANYAKAFLDSGSSIGLNLTASREGSTGLSGLRDINGLVSPLERRTTTDTLSFGGSYNARLGGWQAAFTSDSVLANSDSEIDRRTDSGFDLAQTRTRTIVNKATFTGYPIELPAGELATTVDFGLDWKRLEGSDTRSDTQSSVTRRRLRTGINLVVPITKRDGAWGAIGTLALNLSAGIENLSDFGTQKSWTAGVNWSPFDSLNLQATRIWRQSAPSISALGNPRVETLNVPLIDFATGNEVFASVVSGGNPNLAAETEADWQFSGNWQLPFWTDARLQVDYAVNHSRDVTLQSPSYTAAFESAFPDRVSRDTFGDLQSVDLRPVTLYRSASRTLSFGLSTRGTIGKAQVPQGGGDEQDGRGRGRFGGPPPGGDSGQGRPGGFDANRFQQLRQQFCASPEGTMPDLSQLPEQMRARLAGPDGKPDPVKVLDMRQRFCSERTAEQFEAMRTALCADPLDPAKLPPEMLERLKGPDGEIDQERLARMKSRICATGAALGSRPQASGGPRGGGGLPFGRGGDGRGRYFLNANYSIALQNDVQLALDGPVYDQLAGEVIGGGVVPKHTASLSGGFFWNGYGTRITGNYIGKARLQGSGLPGSSDLFYGDLATLDLRLFANLGDIFKQDSGVLKGFRVALVIDNVFDTRRKVTDAQGNIPDAYNPLRLDPVGRYLGIDLRKMF